MTMNIDKLPLRFIPTVLAQTGLDMFLLSESQQGSSVLPLAITNGSVSGPSIWAAHGNCWPCRPEVGH